MIYGLAMIALSCLPLATTEATIIETQHVEDVLPLMDADTWFLVDLDNCLFEATQALGHTHWFYDRLEQKLQEGMTREEAIATIYPDWVKTQSVCTVKPLEETFVPLLHALQNKGITIMALTHRQPSIIEATMRQIASLGFDFLLTAPSQDTFTIQAKNPAVYVKGILFVSDYNKKSAIFETFLSMIKKSPKKVVFIDDKKKNVEELEILTHYGIAYTGVHYTAIDHVSPVYVREIAQVQSKFLDHIMSNEAALLLMQHGLE